MSVYITGEKDTAFNLKIGEEFPGPLAKYKQELLKVNPHLKSSIDQLLPPHTAVNLICSDNTISVPGAFAREINCYSPDERKHLRIFQENHQDIPSLLALHKLMEEVQDSAVQFRQWFDTPLLSTPWITSGSLSHGSLLDVFGDSSKEGSSFIKKTMRYQKLDALHEAMLKRDALNQELYMLKGQRTRSSTGINRQIKALETEIKSLNAFIKRLLPKRLNDEMSKLMIKRMGFDGWRKMRITSYSTKMAARKTFSTLKLEVLNRSGLERLRKMIKGLKQIGEHTGKICLALNAGFVAYDTYEAYKNNQEWGRTFVSGAAGVGAAAAVGSVISTSTIGAFTIGALIGDAALGGALLISSPVIGTFVAVVAGVVVLSAVAYGASKVAGKGYDLTKEYVTYLWDSETGKEIRDSVSTTVDDALNWLESGWKAGSDWVWDFYGGDKNKTPAAAGAQP